MKISVCMATYNGERYIRQQLSSILSQISLNDEVLISDDQSCDNTVKIINSFKDSRIKVFINPTKIGVVANFNKVLSRSSGDIIFLADQDDVWLEGKVRLTVKRLMDFDLVVTNCMITDEFLNILNYSYFEYANSRHGFFKNIYKSSYLGCCLAFRKRVLNTVLPIPTNLRLYHDWWIGFLGEIKYSVYFERTPLLLYRRHNSSSSPTHSKSKNPLIYKVLFRLQLIILAFLRLTKAI